MCADEFDREGLGETLRSIAREVGESIERLAGQADVDEFAGYVGVDPSRAREWVESTASWLGSQLEHLGDEMATRAEQSAGQAERPSGQPDQPQRREPRSVEEDPLRGAAPHPLDLPTEEQGLALAALESGRWTVEPGSHQLVGDAESGPHDDALGLVRELRARDWITADGRLTLTGRSALSRWLDAAESR
jgi:hypothetical protein